MVKNRIIHVVKESKNKAINSQFEKDLAEAKIASDISNIELIPGLPTEKYPMFEAMYGVNNCGANWKENAEKQANIYWGKGKTVDQLRSILGRGFLPNEVDSILNNYANTFGDKAGQMGVFDNQSETVQETVPETSKGAACVISDITPPVEPQENTGVIITEKIDTTGYTDKQKATIKIANEILQTKPCSKNQLKWELEKKGLSHQDALDGAEFCGADWYVQAEKQAKQFVDKGYDIDEIAQLLSDADFTERQINNGAEYAIKYMGEKVKEQIKYLLSQGFDRKVIIEVLLGTYGFADDEIEKLIDEVNINRQSLNIQ